MSYDVSEKELGVLNTGRLMQANADVLLPLLERQKDSAVLKIISAYRNNQTDHLLALAAELSTIETMRYEITRKIQAAHSIERKIFQGKESENGGTE